MLQQHSCGVGRGGAMLVSGLDPLLSDREIAPLIGRAVSTLQKDRVTGGGIPFVRIGRLVRYRQSDVTAYLTALPSLRSTSEAA
jgi:predicted DNA-binding transcriptional regulator AlpA